MPHVSRVQSEPATRAAWNACPHHDVVECRPGSPQRPAAEALIRRAFAAKHGAVVHTFMPTLLALRGRDGQLCGAAGFREAALEPLFLERYLDVAIENALSDKVGRAIARDDIVEVGNLASCGCRAACRLALMLPSILLARGKRWIVFTATDVVRSMLERHAAPVIELASATESRVQRGPDDWGRYYEHDPRVLAGYLPDGLTLRARRRSR